MEKSQNLLSLLVMRNVAYKRMTPTISQLLIKL